MIDQIDAASIEDRAAEGLLTLLDVRERGEYALGHIPGAVTLSRGLIEVRAPYVLPNPDVPLVLYCDDGHRSRLAAQTLKSMGYTSVTTLSGGLNAWVAAGNTPEYGVNVIGKDFGERVSVSEPVRQLLPDELVALQSREAVAIFDARTEEEYLRGHIPGAFNVPAGQLLTTGVALADSLSAQSVVVHCAGRTRSIIGAFLLQRLGGRDVFALKNGTMAWVMSGKELELEPRASDAVHVSSHTADSANSFASAFASGSSVGHLSASELSELQASNEAHYVLDVRMSHEYQTGRIPGALNCPVGQIANGADELVAVRGARIICYSSLDNRAQIAASLMASIGYRSVTWLKGGLDSWRAEGRATTSKSGLAEMPQFDEARDATGVISPEELYELIASGNTVGLVDVRRSSEFVTGHIAGSHWVPRGDLERRFDDRAVSTETLIVVSNRDLRGALAARTISQMGHRLVLRLEGGIRAWSALGYELVDGIDGADVSLKEAKEDADLTAPRAKILERNFSDMQRYLTWEEQLGEKYRNA